MKQIRAFEKKSFGNPFSPPTQMICHRLRMSEHSSLSITDFLPVCNTLVFVLPLTCNLKQNGGCED